MNGEVHWRCWVGIQVGRSWTAVDVAFFLRLFCAIFWGWLVGSVPGFTSLTFDTHGVLFCLACEVDAFCVFGTYHMHLMISTLGGASWVCLVGVCI
jgi:hypothetical protein